MRNRFFVLLSTLCIVASMVAGALAEKDAQGTVYADRWFAQTVYVPAYSQVFYGDQFKKKPKKFNVAATLSIRNTDSVHPLHILDARYVSHEGAVLQQFIKEVVTLKPLESTEFFIDEGYVEGGMSTSFLVRWQSDEAVTSPVVSAVLIGTQSSQGISFVESGHVLEGFRQ